MEENTRMELLQANDRLSRLIDEERFEEARATAANRDWLDSHDLPADLRRRLEECYASLAQALTPDEHGLRDVPQAKDDRRRAGELLRDWRKPASGPEPSDASEGAAGPWSDVRRSEQDAHRSRLDPPNRSPSRPP
jgi:hypothetical protein